LINPLGVELAVLHQVHQLRKTRRVEHERPRVTLPVLPRLEQNRAVDDLQQTSRRQERGDRLAGNRAAVVDHFHHLPLPLHFPVGLVLSATLRGVRRLHDRNPRDNQHQAAIHHAFSLER